MEHKLVGLVENDNDDKQKFRVHETDKICNSINECLGCSIILPGFLSSLYYIGRSRYLHKFPEQT